jgi:hypothetical protein
MIFARRFAKTGRTFGLSVARDPRSGWAVQQEENGQVVKVSHYHDWHRVERQMAVFQVKASALQEAGWQELIAPASDH